jgi:DNA-binding NarL/FixJ family response regulator
MIHAKPIRVLIVDDHPMVRQALHAVLQPYSNIHVVGEASDGQDAVALAEKLDPTVVVMNINLPRMDGITAARSIKERSHGMVIIGITSEPHDYRSYAMKRAGAVDVLKTDNAVSDLYAAIQQAVAATKPVLILDEAPIANHSLDVPFPPPTTEPPKRSS